METALLAAIMIRVALRFGSEELAREWLCSEQLSGFGGQTAMDLLRANRGDDVLAYLDSIDAGIHA